MQIRDKGWSLPGYPTISEAKLDELTRVYLNALVRRNLVVSFAQTDLVAQSHKDGCAANGTKKNVNG